MQLLKAQVANLFEFEDVLDEFVVDHDHYFIQKEHKIHVVNEAPDVPDLFIENDFGSFDIIRYILDLFDHCEIDF